MKINTFSSYLQENNTAPKKIGYIIVDREGAAVLAAQLTKLIEENQRKAVIELSSEENSDMIVIQIQGDASGS